MVIADFDMLGSFLSPPETNPPLIVDPDAELSNPIALQRFEAVRSETGQILKPRGRGENRQTAARLIGRRILARTEDAKR